MTDCPDGHPLPESGDEADASDWFHQEEVAVPGPQASMWYVAVGGQVFGPADAVALRQWAAEGRLPGGAQVCQVGSDTWVLPSSVPELRDLPVLAPPPPPVPYAAAAPAAYRASGRGICPCPDCGGNVRNVAPAYGWPWGLWQRALKPKFACEACGAPIAFSRLTKAAQAQVTHTMRVAFAGWIVVVVFVICGIASPFLVALAYN